MMNGKLQTLRLICSCCSFIEQNMNIVTIEHSHVCLVDSSQHLQERWIIMILQHLILLPSWLLSVNVETVCYRGAR